MGEVLWITNVGKQVYAVINPLWAWCIEGHPIPTEIYLIWNEAVKKELEMVIELITRLYSFIGGSPAIRTEKIPEDFKSYYNEFSKFISNILKRDDVELLVMDMTPGRKFMSVVIADQLVRIKRIIGERGLKMKAKIVYLHLLDMTYQNAPYPLIPLPKQYLWVR